MQKVFATLLSLVGAILTMGLIIGVVAAISVIAMVAWPVLLIGGGIIVITLGIRESLIQKPK